MTLGENTPTTRAYKWGRHRAILVLIRRNHWRWRVYEGDAVIGKGRRFTLERARRDAEITIEAARAAGKTAS